VALAIQIADALIPLVLDFRPIERQLNEIEKMIRNLERQLAALQKTAIEEFDLGGFQTIPGSLRAATAPDSPSGRGFSLGEDIGATLRLLSFRMPTNPIGLLGSSVAYTTGGMLLEKEPQSFTSSILRAADNAVNAGMQAAEAFSPSRKMAHEVTEPVMAGITQGVVDTTPLVEEAMQHSMDRVFADWTGESVPAWEVPAMYTAPVAPVTPRRISTPPPRHIIRNAGNPRNEYEQAVNRGIQNAMRYLGAR
jgi:hypothetical protein